MTHEPSPISESDICESPTEVANRTRRFAQGAPKSRGLGIENLIAPSKLAKSSVSNRNTHKVSRGTKTKS
jgi:hypothetical protein